MTGGVTIRRESISVGLTICATNLEAATAPQAILPKDLRAYIDKRLCRCYAGCLMVGPFYTKAISVIAALALLLIPLTADGKGGRSRGRIVGRPASVQPASTAVALPSSTQSQQTSPLSTGAAISTTTAIPRASKKAVQTVPSAPTTPPPAPTSVIGTPAPQLQAITPLPPPATTTSLTAGGTARTDTLTSPSSSSSSPSESAASTAGGGGKSLQDCMAFWDPDAHMTKAEWKGACTRSLHRWDNLRIESLGLTAPRRN
jgi:hypothetical protein